MLVRSADNPMKRSSSILITVVLFFLVLVIFLNPLVKLLAWGQLKRIFPGSTVTISSCSFNPFRQLSFSGIQVTRKDYYDFKIRNILVYFNPDAFIKRMPFNPWELIKAGQITVDSLETSQFRLNSGYLKVSRQGKGEGVIAIQEVKAGKLVIKDILGKAWLKDDYLFLDPLSARLLGGRLEGDSQVKLSGDFVYQANLNFFDLDQDTFVKDFELDEKVDVSGKVGGSLKLKGKLQEIEILEGNFSAGKDGGILTIKDRQFLERLARSSRLGPDLVVESFQNYRYNTGVITASLQDNNIVLFFNLAGPGGKRNFNIIHHDFNQGRKE